MDQQVWYIAQYVASASLQAPVCASKMWEWLCTGLMHVLTTAFLFEADKLQGQEACSGNQSMGVALCKPVNGQILCIYAHVKQTCGFRAIAGTKVQLQNVGMTHEECMPASLHLLSQFVSQVIQSGSDPDNCVKQVWPE